MTQNQSALFAFFQVYTDIEDKKEWHLCFSVPGVRLPTGYYFGASAATGELSGKSFTFGGMASWLILAFSDNHDIIAMKMYEIEFTRTEKQGETDRDSIVPQAQHFAAPRGECRPFIADFLSSLRH